MMKIVSAVSSYIGISFEYQTLRSLDPFNLIKKTQNIFNYYCNKWIGPVFRRLFLPLDEKAMSTPSFASSIRECGEIFDPYIEDAQHRDKKTVWSYFIPEVKQEKIDIDGNIYRITLRVYRPREEFKKGNTHFCFRIGGNQETLGTESTYTYPFLSSFVKKRKEDENLYFVQASLYDIEILKNGEFIKWQPSKAHEFGHIFFSLLNSFKHQDGIIFDSICCYSLGSCILEELKNIKEVDIVPKIFILDRAMPSLWKTIRKMYGMLGALVFHRIAYMADWHCDPENSILTFFHNMRLLNPSLSSLAGRKVIVIQVSNDRFFTYPNSSFNEDFSRQLQTLKVGAYQDIFHVNEVKYHTVSHHGVPIDHIKNGNNTIENPAFPLLPSENIIDCITRCVFLYQK